MKILLIGIEETPHLGGVFRRGLKALGHQVYFVDESAAYGWLDKHATRTLIWPFRGNLPTRLDAFNRTVLRIARDCSPDLILSLKGSYLSPETLESLKRTTGSCLANYSTDDPFNPAASTDCIRQSIALWDAYVTPRAHTIPELQRHCKGLVMYLPFGYDPELHSPERHITRDEELEFNSDIVFIGVCDRDRVQVLKFLTSRTNVAVRLYGGGRRYQLVKKLRDNHRGFAVGRNYRLALCCSKIALSMNRRANRDTHVMRTFEIPACGSFMLAERTEEQCAMFDEDREAVFFSGEEELWDKAAYYLKHEDNRVRIARAGFQRVTSGRNTYRDRLATLLDRIGIAVRKPKLTGQQ